MQRVLVVEDEALLLQVIKTALSSITGVTIRGARTVADALEEIEIGPPDLLITDLSLPDGSGLQVIERLEHIGRCVPVIIQTGVLSQFRQSLPPNERLVVLEKPISMKELRDQVGVQLGERRGQIAPFGVVDYLQLASFGRRSLLLTVRLADEREGFVSIIEGDVWQAKLDEHVGVDAIATMVTNNLTRVEVNELEATPERREILVPMQVLLLELARLDDESKHLGVDLDPASSGVFAMPKDDDDDDEGGDAGSEGLDWSDLVETDAPSSSSSSSSSFSPTEPEPPREENFMATINQVCEEIVDDVQDAVACGVVDLDTGMLMGVHHTIAYFTQSYLDAVAAAAVDMFRGKNVRRVEKLISKHRGEEITDAFEEIFISSKAVFHFMKLIPGKSAVVVLVTRKTTNQGMGWSSLRMAMDQIIESLP
ncbi:response regulator [Pseudenhygromyxa sp. WMMC2535]|uniref:response regulator n=1 Tax=Pseudenhygromyxa sp. WMMC2535 TaxID=2712867 RepID=UPI00155390C4|nr:response regulator [Pseudenhygromyxa sp. WMMC2535]NVB37045.1 response regulator [Pseudenhygromyxa sp. WMMC2535]